MDGIKINCLSYYFVSLINNLQKKIVLNNNIFVALLAISIVVNNCVFVFPYL